jgi:hypothetical protein
LREREVKVGTVDFGLEAFEKMLVRREDKRNEASGNGFIRLFPSDATK